ncbi:MAG: TIGR02206 family membrane protein [Verrucomicrobiota bacterium]
MQRDFTIFGIEHWIVIILTIVIPFGLGHWVRASTQGIHSKVCKNICYGWAAVFVINKFIQLWWTWEQGVLSLQNGLPLHLCDWATLTAVLTLIFRWHLTYELTFFWALTGTINAVMTPDLNESFPHLRFICFFVSHSGLIAVVIFLTYGMRWRPTWSSLWKAFLGCQVYFMFVQSINWLIDANYGYLMAKPANPSMLDYLGPWPWYILSMEVLCLAFFLIYYAPFALADWLRAKRCRKINAED